MNKKGWIKIIEAVIAIILVVSVLLIVINQGYIGKKDISLQIYETEILILREIQLDDDLRKSILNADLSNWDEKDFPEDIKEKITERTPNYLECEARICEMGDSCEFWKTSEENIYAQSVAITTTISQEQELKYRQLKLFCWVK